MTDRSTVAGCAAVADVASKYLYTEVYEVRPLTVAMWELKAWVTHPSCNPSKRLLTCLGQPTHVVLS